MNYIRFCLLVFACMVSLRADVLIYEGDLDGAPYKVATPQDWRGGSVFFIVNGWRPPEAPHFADLDVTDRFVQQLLEAGWAVARTAFKENGVDHEAHTEALRDLKQWIQSELGELERVVMEGESTAGTLLLRIAEQHPELADGVIAMGAFIELEDTSSGDYLTANTLIPAILMSNLSEIEGPVAYTASALDAPVTPSLRPLRRPGHVNVNWVERWDALRAMDFWLEEGTLPVLLNGTRKVPQRETGTRTEEDGLFNQVTAVNPFFGNALLGFHPEELAGLGLTQGDFFVLEAHSREWTVFYGESYGDVALGEWVAFPNADDQILVARNHQSAIETAGLAVGDTVALRWQVD